MIRLAALAAVTLALAGCTTTVTLDTPTVSDECRAALATLENTEQNTATEDQAVVASTTACATVDEYIAGVKENPASWLYDNPADVDKNRDLIIIAACGTDETTPMCKDATEQGIL